MSRKHISEVLLACLVLVAVNITPNDGVRSAFGEYGDRNIYTSILEKRLTEVNETGMFSAVCEGRRDTVAVVTVSPLWSSQSEEWRK